MIDLHLHLDGSLTVNDIIELAGMQGTELPSYDTAELKKHLSFEGEERTLTKYLTYFDLPLSVLQTKETVSRAVELLVKRMARIGMLYVEIRFAPLLHTERGLTVDEVTQSAIEGLRKGLTDSRLIAQIILCCMRQKGTAEQNEETVLATAKYLGKGVCAVDLAGAEEGFCYDDYAELFSKARELKLPITIHAGERGGSECVAAAIKLGAVRIGHGVRLIDDDALVAEVVKRGIGIEMCPTSNYQTGATPDFNSYPIIKYLQRGVAVTVNTDSTVVSSTNIHKEFELLEKECGMTLEQKVKCLFNSVKIAFLPDSIKDLVRGRLLEALAKQAEV